MDIPHYSFLNTPENSTCFFFNWSLEFLHARSISLEEFPCPHPLPPVFFWNNPLPHVYKVTVCLFCSDIHIPTLKYTGLSGIFDWITQPYTVQLLLGYFRKNPSNKVEEMEFPGVLDEERAGFKKRSEIFWGDKKIHVEFQWILVFGWRWNFQGM